MSTGKTDFCDRVASVILADSERECRAGHVPAKRDTLRKRIGEVINGADNGAEISAACI